MARQSKQNCDSFESIKNIVLGVIHVLMWKKKTSPMMAHGSVALLSLSKMEQKPGRPSATVAEMIARCLGQKN